MAIDLNIFQLNCHRSRSVFTSFDNETPSGSYLFLLQEPYLHQHNVCGLDKTRLYFLRDIDTRTAIYASPDLKLTLHSNLSSRDCTTCSLVLNGECVFFSSVYLDINTTVEEPGWMRTIARAQAKQKAHLTMVDSNAHSRMWGCQDSNPRGLELEDVIATQGLTLLNTGHKPTFETQHGSSIIDLTLASPALANRITRWQVHDEMHLSDHHLISCTIHLAPERLPVRKGRKLKEANWTKFQTLMETSFEQYQTPTLWSPTIIEESVTFLQTAITAALDEVAKIVTFRPKKTYFDWWRPDLDTLKKAARQAHKAARRAPQTPDKWSQYHKLRSELKYACQKARRTSWQSFTSEAQTMPLAAKLNRIMRRQTFRQLGVLKHPDGSFTDSVKDSYHLLMKEHFPAAAQISSSANQSDPIPMAGRYSHPVLVNQPEWIDEKRLKEALHSFGKDKAAGPDGIKPIILCHLPDNAQVALSRIYAAMIELHYTPALWRKSEIVFIPKPGKSDYSNPRAYRPISLMSFFLKTLERLVQWRMEETASPYHRNQHAFRAGHCTEHALSHMTDLIERAKFSGNVALVVFLDIEGAFDTLSGPAIARGMKRHGVEGNLTSWYTKYLRHRVCQVQGQYRPYHVKDGTGQGGVLSPVVWNYTMDSFLNEFNSGPVKAIGYADDGALVVISRELRTARKHMQSALRKAYYWAFRTGLRFSASKTTAVIFSEYESQLSAPLTLGTDVVKVANQATYLGVLFDYRLSWEPHIAKKVLAAKRHLMLLRGIAGPTWGPPPHICRWLYTCVVRPALTYGAIVWAKSTQSKGIQNQLKKAQRLGLVMIAPIRQNTPTAGLEMIAHVVPLHIRIQELAVSTYSRLGRPPDGWSGKIRTRLGHLLWLDKKSKTFVHHTLQDRCVEHVWDRHFSASIGDGSDELNLRGIRGYTDGSVMYAGGSGIALYRHGVEEPILTDSQFVGSATVFQAELNAIKMACNACMALPDIRVTLFCDSQAAILAIHNTTIQSRTVLNAVKALNALGDRKIVHLQWIKGHNGSPGNELADYMAKKGSREAIIGPSPFLPMPLIQVKAISRAQVLSLWSQEWSPPKPCRQTKIFFPYPDPSRSFDLLRNSRKEVGTLFRALTGHNFTNYHRHKVNNAIDPLCRLCSLAPESSSHIIKDCTAIAGLRHSYFGEYNLDDAWEPSILLDFLKDPEISILEVDPSDLEE
jgi:ribonuclease HI/retron-type reverse transcriptase